jgi:hypothetical protein
MADLTLTAANIAPVFVEDCEIRPKRCSVAVTAGQTVTQTTTGPVALADANVSGSEEVYGICLDNVAANTTANILRKGGVFGYDLSGLSVGDVVYQSDTAGALSTTAGTKSVEVGRVACRNDAPDYTKYLEVYFPPAKKR